MREEKKEWEDDWVKLLAVINCALSSGDEPFVRYWLAKYTLNTPPSGSHMRSKVIPRVVNKMEKRNRMVTEGKVAMLNCDAWNNIRRQHLVAFVVVVEGEVRRRISECLRGKQADLRSCPSAVLHRWNRRRYRPQEDRRARALALEEVREDSGGEARGQDRLRLYRQRL